MKKLMNMLILLCLISVVSCTEEISEDIQNQATSTPSTPSSPSVADSSSIRVVNNKDPLLSYVIHKAGSVDEACELSSPSSGFDANDYENDDSNYVVDCILDAEEYDIFFDGIDLDVQVDENLCEYVEYKPFKYFQWQPGFTQRTIYEVECAEFCQTDAATQNLCGNTYATYPGGSSLSFSNRITDLEASALCMYDYSDEESGEVNGPNCDEGKVNVVVLTLDPDDPDSPTTCDAGGGLGYVTEAEATETECGGEVTACYGGAATNTANLDLDETSIVYQNLSLDSLTIDVSTESSPFENEFTSNLSVANFSRVCSDTTNTKVNSDFDVLRTTLAGDEVETMTDTTSFAPIPIDIEEDGVIDHYALARHPLDGVGITASARNDVSPYYSIRCLDRARDTKAQIRIFVREWDRTFDTDNLFLARLSDVNQGVNARMDASGEQEPGRPWNNFLDWDDLFVDYDFNSSLDSNVNDLGGNLDPVFISNQCTDINTGYCFDGLGGASAPGFTNQTTCEAASVNHYWIPGTEAFPKFNR